MHPEKPDPTGRTSTPTPQISPNSRSTGTEPCHHRSPRWIQAYAPGWEHNACVSTFRDSKSRIPPAGTRSRPTRDQCYATQPTGTVAQPAIVKIPGSAFTPAGIALLVMIVRPVSSNFQNGVILALALFVGIAAIISRGWKASTQVSLLWLVAMSGGAIWSLLGGIKLNPGWVQESLFFVVFPAIFMVIIAAAGRRTLGSLLAAIPIGMAIVSALSLVYLASVRGLLPEGILDSSNLGFGVGEGPGGIDPGEVEFGFRIRAYNLSSLAFGAPFLIALVTLGIRFENRVADWIRWPSLVLTLSCLLISGRRGLIVATAVTSIFFVVLLMIRSQEQQRHASVRSLSLIALAGVLALYSSGFRVGDFIDNLFGSSGDVRLSTQVPAFLASINQSPVIGHGLGHALEQYKANIEEPWQYEVQYLLLLNAMGLVGILFLLVPTLYILVVAGRMALGSGIDGAVSLAVLMGTMGVLIGNATNPYLHAVGHYWMFFLTVFIVDLHLRWSPKLLDSGPTRLTSRDLSRALWT